jgi:hypothetical protein
MTATELRIQSIESYLIVNPFPDFFDVPSMKARLAMILEYADFCSRFVGDDIAEEYLQDAAHLKAMSEDLESPY